MVVGLLHLRALHPGQVLLADPEHLFFFFLPKIDAPASCGQPCLGSEVPGCLLPAAAPALPMAMLRLPPFAVSLARNLVSVPGRGSLLLISLVIYSAAAVNGCNRRAANNRSCSFLL